MITVKFQLSHPSKTVPGRTVSCYKSTPLSNPTAEQLSAVLKEHIDSISHHLKICDPSKLRVNISLE